VKGLYCENYKTFVKETEEDARRQKDVHGLAELIL
jgi:hypothetical protein